MKDFSELRSNLARFIGMKITPSTIKELKSEIVRLSFLRAEVSPKRLELPSVVEILPDIITSPIKDDNPEEVVNTRPRYINSSIPSSVSYNAERYIPYRILWAKVIIRATYDYALWKDSPDPRLRKFAQDAEKWLFESSDLELSFESICFAFDFPVEKIRQQTRLLTRNDVKKLEFRERHGRSDLIEDTRWQP